MIIEEARCFLFQQGMLEECVKHPIYIINGSADKQDEPVVLSDYLIMINSNGDTIAGRSPNSQWSMYPIAIKDTHPNITSHLHAITIP
ncbi:hypothetical protein [Citrobacter braakii]|uniref:hypothetical protein n=1 Tax=Citrobacter braakii TaxID=57706 RepID=UPI00397A2676